MGCGCCGGGSSGNQQPPVNLPTQPRYVEICYEANSGGVGYSVGDRIYLVQVYDPPTAVLPSSSYYYNLDTAAQINPNTAHLTPCLTDRLRAPVQLCDDNGAFLEHVTYRNDTITIEYTALDGSSYTPVGTIRQCTTVFSDLEIRNYCYRAVANGTGYSENDKISYELTYDLSVSDSVPQSTRYYNVTTQSTITPDPLLADLQPCSSATTNDLEVRSYCYDVITTGTGYTSGDRLYYEQVYDLLLDTSTPTVTRWFNVNTQLALGSPPNNAHITPCADSSHYANTSLILCDGNGQFIRNMEWDNGVLTVTDTDLDGVAYVTVGSVVKCQDGDFIQLCDKQTNGDYIPFLRSHDTQTGVMKLDITPSGLPYTVTGTVVSCDKENMITSSTGTVAVLANSSEVVTIASSQRVLIIYNEGNARITVDFNTIGEAVQTHTIPAYGSYQLELTKFQKYLYTEITIVNLDLSNDTDVVWNTMGV